MEELERIIWISIVLIIIISVKDKMKMALPILLVVAGLLLSLTHIIPEIELSPEMIFYVVLPPILFDAAWNTSIPDFKKELPKISILAFGLVFLTTTIVALFVHSLIPDLSWAMAFVLGAIVSPPDAVAATSITKSIPLPKKLITILEGESLLNDASALIAYKCAVIAIVSGTFSLWDAGFKFIVISLGGIFVGLSIGFLFLKVHKFLNGNSNIETFAVILLPFATYSLAEHLESSGVLAVVILGMYLSWNSFSVFKTNSRIQMGHFWEVMIFIFNGFVFLLLGMQLPKIISDIPHNQIPLLIFNGFLIFLILVMVRLFVLFISPIFTETNYIKSKRKFSQSGKEYLILSWAGMRGVVSLAAAFALPVKDGLDTPIEDRSTVLFLSFIVIILTLLIQGITLPRLIKLIKPVQNESQEESELNKLLLQKSISYLHQIPTDNNISNEVYKRMLSKLQNEEVQLLNKKDSISEKIRQLEWKKIYFRLELQLAEYQRKELAKSYHNGTFSLETIRKKEWELDFWVTTVQQEMEQLEQQFL